MKVTATTEFPWAHVPYVYNDTYADTRKWLLWLFYFYAFCTHEFPFPQSVLQYMMQMCTVAHGSIMQDFGIKYLNCTQMKFTLLFWHFYDPDVYVVKVC